MSRTSLFLIAALHCARLAGASADGPLTLDAALSEAHAANARLPVAAFDAEISREAVREARAERWFKVALEADFLYAPPSGYDPVITNGGEERLQAVGRQPLYDGGARRAAVSRARSRSRAAEARYRAAEKDLELEVRGRFGEWLEAESEIEARQEGLERLRRYRTWLRSRQASGQAVAADVLKTDVHIAGEEADLAEVERRREAARLELNDLLGRDPSSPLELASLPPPQAPARWAEAAWGETPEVAEAAARAGAAAAEVAIAEAQRKPVVSATADVGLWGSDTSHLVPPDLRAADPHAGFGDRLKRDLGYSIGLSLSWPFWDRGVRSARLAQAALGLRQAQGEETVERRRARLRWEQAHSALAGAYRQIEILGRALPDARDSFLEAESRYRGGAATSLEVLEAHAASVEAAVRFAEAVLRYRVAQALELRWGRK